jgi:hypothetical protein
MGVVFHYITEFSILVAVIISLIRIYKINSIYYPFIVCLIIGTLNEILSVTLNKIGYRSTANNNIYVLVESILFLLLFKNWESFNKKKYLFWVFAGLFIVTWVVEIFFIRPIYPYASHGIFEIASYFRILYSSVLVLLAINLINQIITRDRKNILLNPIFLICSAIVFYFTYKILIEAFYTYGLTSSKENLEFAKNVYRIHDWINLFSNLVYAFAILWIQKRQRFLLPS